MNDDLEEILGGVPAGRLAEADARRIEPHLAHCWDSLSGDSIGGMEPYKIIGRTEEMKWRPPILSFKIERHGGFVNGSTRAEIQNWEIDFERRTRELISTGRRQMYPMDARLDVKPLAEEIATLIDEGRDDHRIVKRGNTVRIIMRNVIPVTNRQTTLGRNQRFAAALEPLLVQRGWHRKLAGSHLIFGLNSD